MHNPPRLSLVMAVKNASRYLRGALDSVMAQTQPVSEIVIVDGRSTDDTVTIATGYSGVRVIQESGRGFASAWNDGIRASTGELVALLDSDDFWPPEKTARQVAALAADPDAGCVTGHVQFFAEPGEPLPSSFRPDLLNRSHVAYVPGALLARRRTFDDVGLFDPSWEIASDIDWFAKLKDRHVKLSILPQIVLHKRVHARNLLYLAAETPVINDEILRVLRQSIHRQRRAEPTDAGNT